MKKCCKCKALLEAVEFSKDKRRPDGLRSDCRSCLAAYNKAYQAKHKDRIKQQKKTYDKLHRNVVRERQVQKVYSLSADEHGALREMQANACAICYAPVETLRRDLAIDHNHRTGEVRGLLCDRHNMALGLFDDDTRLLRRAVDYLELPSLMAGLEV